MDLFSSPIPLDDADRRYLVESLQTVVSEGLCLQLDAKTAHWNVKGPQFKPLHDLFESVAEAIRGHNDDLAERLVQLGGLAKAEPDTDRDAIPLTADPDALLRHIKDALEEFLAEARKVRTTSEGIDIGTFDLLNAAVIEMEKLGWMLHATLEST